MTVVDAFVQYYAVFTRDQDYLEANLAGLATPVTVVWDSENLYIKQEMGTVFAARIGTAWKLLLGVGHYPHLLAPAQAIAGIRATMG